MIVRKKYGRTLHNLDFPYVHKVLYISFDRFLLAVESRDLSQAGKRIIRVYKNYHTVINDAKKYKKQNIILKKTEINMHKN